VSFFLCALCGKYFLLCVLVPSWLFTSSGVDFLVTFVIVFKLKELYVYVGSRIGDFKLTYWFYESSKRDTSYLSVKIFLEDKIKKTSSLIFLRDKFFLLKLLKSMYVFDLKYYVQVLL